MAIKPIPYSRETGHLGGQDARKVAGIRAIAEEMMNTPEYQVLQDALNTLNKQRIAYGGYNNQVYWDVWTLLGNDWINQRDIPRAVARKAQSAAKRLAKKFAIPEEERPYAVWMFVEAIIAGGK